VGKYSLGVSGRARDILRLYSQVLLYVVGGGGVARRYSFLPAIASSFALATEDKRATAGPTARGPPVHPAQNFHLDNPEMKADQEALASQPAGVGAIMRPPTQIGL